VEDQCYLYIEKNVATLNVNSGAKNATIGIDYYAKVTEANVDAAIELYGRGDIGTLYLNASNCTISRGLDIGKTTKASGVKGTSYTYDDWYWGDAYKTYCTDHGVYDYCDWEYWYGDGWCPFHERYDDCWWDYGYGAGYTPAAKTYSVSVSGTGLSCSTSKVNANAKLGSLTLNTTSSDYDLTTAEITNISIGGSVLDESKYDLSNGTITFTDDVTATGTIVITASVKKVQYSVTVTATTANVTAKVGSETLSGTSPYAVDTGSTLVLTFTSDAQTVTVTDGNDNAINFTNSGNNYTITLKITGNLTVKITETSAVES
jgi:hypothetical protein